jgi:flagellar basal body-associated protein FliL
MNLKIIIPVVLVALGGVYKFVLAKPAEAGPPPKVAGEVYVLPKEFLVNLKDGKFAKLAIALVFDHGYHSAPVASVETPEEGTAMVAYAGAVPSGWSDIPPQAASARPAPGATEAAPSTVFVGGAPPAPDPPEGYGLLKQEALIRAIITDELTQQDSRELMSAKGRKKLRKHLVERFHKETDVKVHDVLITDVAVQ